MAVVGVRLDVQRVKSFGILYWAVFAAWHAAVNTRDVEAGVERTKFAVATEPDSHGGKEGCLVYKYKVEQVDGDSFICEYVDRMFAKVQIGLRRDEMSSDYWIDERKE